MRPRLAVPEDEFLQGLIRHVVQKWPPSLKKLFMAIWERAQDPTVPADKLFEEAGDELGLTEGTRRKRKERLLLACESWWNDTSTRRQFFKAAFAPFLLHPFAQLQNNVATLLEWSPTIRTARLGVWWQEVSRLQQLLATSQAPFILEQVRRGAMALQRALTAHNEAGAEAAHLWNNCDKLLRDTGESEYSPDAIQRLSAYGWRVLWFAAEEAEDGEDEHYLELIDDLLSQANFLRSESKRPGDKNWQDAIALLQWVFDLFQGPCRRPLQYDLRFMRRAHQAALWLVRLIAAHAGEADKATAALQFMRAVAADINTPLVWFETLVEECTYWRIRYIGTGNVTYLCRAEESLFQAQTIVSKTPTLLPVLQFRVLRVQIELFPTLGRQEEVIPPIKHFAHLWPEFPGGYHLRQLRVWQEDYGLPQEPHSVPGAVYTLPLLPFLYSAEVLSDTAGSARM